MRHSEKAKPALDTRKPKLQTLIIFIVGIFCIAYLVSGGNNFIKNWIELRHTELSKIRVEVLNGTDVKGLAEDATKFLRQRGFDVVRYGNADNKIAETVIIDRADRNLKNGKLVQNALKQGKLSYEPHPLGLLEVSVVIGVDFRIKRVVNTSGEGGIIKTR